MKVLIFGIGGFVGTYLAKEFINHGYDVYGSDICENKKLPSKVVFHESNLLDGISVEVLVHKLMPDMIINLAAISSVGNSWNIPQTTIAVNVIGTLNILEAAKKQTIKPKIMLIGSSEEYESSKNSINEKMPLNANNPYGISKMAQEKFAKLYRNRYGMKIYCVRSFNHTGVGQKETFVIPGWCRQVAQISKSKKSGIIHVGNLSVVRDFSNVKDIVNAYRLIIESDDCEIIYNVGSGKAVALSEILKYIISLSKQPIKVETDAELIRPLENPVICCDHSLITTRLGWTPKYDIFETIDEIFNYYVHCSENNI